jgi:hypothetical protein
VAALSKIHMVLDREAFEIMDSNLARGVDVCPYLSVLCCAL